MAHPTPFERNSSVPAAQGLYDPRREKDACGLAMVATLRGTAGHDIVSTALEALRHLEHRGAVGSDAGTGDGAGIVTQIPDAFLRAVAGFELPPLGRYAVGMSFLPLDEEERGALKSGIARIASEEGLAVLGWRDVPTDPEHLGTLAREAAPAFEQLFLESSRTDDKGVIPRRHRARPADLPSPQACRARTGRLLPVALGPHAGLQGHGDDAPARAVLSRSQRRALRVAARARALALLDQHLPVVAARPAVPHDRPQRRDQHRAGQPQLDARPAEPARIRAARRPPAAVPHRERGCERFGLVRRGRRTAHPRRPVPSPRDHDDGAGGVGEPGRHRPDPAGVLRVPFDAHGAVGRAGGAGLHRRNARRRDARPQRPPSRPVPGHRRRSRGARQRDRRARLPGRPHRAQGTSASREDVPGRHVGGPHRRGRRDQGRAGSVAAVAGLARRGPHPSRRPPRARTHHAHSRVGGAPPAHVRLHRGGGPHPGRADGPARCRAARRHGIGHPDRGAERPPAAALRLLHPAVRAGHQPAPRLDPRRGGHLDEPRTRTRAQSADRLAGARPSDRARLPGHRQRPAREGAALRDPDGTQARPRHPGAVPHRQGAEGTRQAAAGDVRRGRRGDRERLAVPGAERSRLERGSRADPVAAHARRRSPSPDPSGDQDEGGHHRRGR